MIGRKHPAGNGRCGFETKLSLVITNLVENAKYNIEWEGWVRVTVDADHLLSEGGGFWYWNSGGDAGSDFDRFFWRTRPVPEKLAEADWGLPLECSSYAQGVQLLTSKEGEGSMITVRIP